jgi:hypothetical protein
VEKCKNCSIRKYYAKAFDTHFDKKDCTCECPEEIESLRNIISHKEAEIERLQSIIKEIVRD